MPSRIGAWCQTDNSIWFVISGSDRRDANKSNGGRRMIGGAKKSHLAFVVHAGESLGHGIRIHQRIRGGGSAAYQVVCVEARAVVDRKPDVVRRGVGTLLGKKRYMAGSALVPGNRMPHFK